VPLITDMVFDESLPLKPPPKPSSGAPRRGPDYDPDTIDLFGDNLEINEAVAEELRNNADEVIETIVSEYTAEIEQRLREELTAQLGAILEDLNHPPESES